MAKVVLKQGCRCVESSGELIVIGFHEDEAAGKFIEGLQEALECPLADTSLFDLTPRSLELPRAFGCHCFADGKPKFVSVSGLMTGTKSDAITITGQLFRGGNLFDLVIRIAEKQTSIEVKRPKKLERRGEDGNH